MIVLRARTTQLALSVGVRIVESSHSNNHVSCNQESAFEIVTPTVQNKEVNNEGSDKERDGFEEIEVERHFPVQTPSKKNNDGRDKECWKLS